MWRIALAKALIRGGLVLGPLVLSGGVGCKEAKGSLYTCDCPFLTDTDDTSVQKVEICESSPARAQSAAMGCAQSGAPASVQSCSCTPAPRSSSGVCRVGDCAVREHR